MANYCDYKGILKGPKNACYGAFGYLEAYDDKQIVQEFGTPDNYTLRFALDSVTVVSAASASIPGMEFAHPDNVFVSIDRVSRMHEIDLAHLLLLTLIMADNLQLIYFIIANNVEE